MDSAGFYTPFVFLLGTLRAAKDLVLMGATDFDEFG